MTDMSDKIHTMQVGHAYIHSQYGGRATIVGDRT